MTGSGPLPRETQQLLEITAIKHASKRSGISKIKAGPKGVTLAFREDAPLDPQKLVAWVGANQSKFKLRPDRSLVATGVWPDPTDRMKAVKRLLDDVSGVLVEPEAA